MDNTTDLHSRLAMAKTLFCALKGRSVDDHCRALSVKYSRNLFESPWEDESDSRTKAYAERFFGELSSMGKTTGLVDRWQCAFDASDEPNDPQLARDFISDFFREHYSQPRHYHDFTCHRKDVRRQGVLDFPMEYPLAVEFWVIYVSLAGRGSLEVNGKVYEIEPKTIVVVPPGCSCVIARHCDASAWNYDWLSFRSKLEWLELLDNTAELTSPACVQASEDEDFFLLLQQLEQLERTRYEPGATTERLCNNIIENILIRISLLAGDTFISPSKVNAKVRKAVDFILNHYQEDISLKVIASAVSVSPSRLSAVFRENFGVSVIKWRDQIRMKKARELLKNTASPVSRVAILVGYSDALYFSRRFKEHYGYSPSHLREHG